MGTRVITIGRQYGSGGRLIGKALAEKLGVRFYDKRLLKLAQERSGISEEELLNADERRSDPWRFQVEDDIREERKRRIEPVNDLLFRTQSQIILELADKEDCVIVGRCANYILRDKQNCRSVFIYAPEDVRIKTIMERSSLDEREAAMVMKRVDKQRRYYHNYYTDEKWGSLTNYQFSLDSSAFTREQIVEILETVYKTI
ncbi:MAG: cytidylate kinase-like family protein [Blautia sp.]|mgnify:FL=1